MRYTRKRDQVSCKKRITDGIFRIDSGLPIAIFKYGRGLDGMSRPIRVGADDRVTIRQADVKEVIRPLSATTRYKAYWTTIDPVS